MGGKGVSKRMERYALADSGRIGRLMEHAVELAGCHRLTGPLAWKQPALLHGSCGIETPPPRLPPLARRVGRAGRHMTFRALPPLDWSNLHILFPPLCGLVFHLDTPPPPRPP